MDRSLFLTVGLIVILITGIVAPVGLVMGVKEDSASTTEPPTGTNAVAISESLQNASGDTTVVVQLQDPDKATLHAASNATATLQSQADRTQQPVLRFVNTTEGVTVERRHWITNAVVLTVDTTQVDLNQITAIEGVEQLHANVEVQINSTQPRSQSTTVNTSLNSNSTTDSHGYTYGVNQINAPEVWSQFDTKGEGATVAVIDTGVDTTNHPELEPIESGWIDMVYDRAEPYDKLGHGTHVSGTVVGHEATSGFNAGKAYGVAPDAGLLHAQVFKHKGEDEGTASYSDIVAAMEWAVQHESGVDVISMSLGGEGYFSGWIDPIENTKATGIVVIASIGNNGENTSGSPGNIYTSLAVGASTESRTIADFSGGEVIDTSEAYPFRAPPAWPAEYTVPDVAAPGDRVLSALSGGGYGYYWGTSMAAPHVAGAVALIQAATAETLAPTEIETALMETARKPDGQSTSADTRYGNGIIDVQAAIQQVENPNYKVQNMDAPQTVTQNKSYTVTTTVENQGPTVPETVTYSLETMGGETVITTEERVTITEGATTSLEMKVTANQTANVSGNYTHVVATSTSAVRQAVEITEPIEPSATRSLTRSIVQPNGTVQVTVSATVPNKSSDLQIIDQISTGPAVQDVTIVDADDATVAEVTNASDLIFASYGGTNTAAVTYEIMVGNETALGEEIVLNGTVVDAADGLELLTTGDSTVEIGNSSPLLPYAGPDGVVGARGLGDAASDFRGGSISPQTLGNVAAAFRSGKPVS